MKLRILIAFFLGLTINFLSCKEEPESIGSELVENQLKSSTTDTITLSAHTIIDDSVVTYRYWGDGYQNLLAFHYVGNYSDPIFGDVKSGIFTQLSVEEKLPEFTDTDHVDSVVLLLDLKNHYGNPSSDVNFKVHKLEEPLIQDEDTIYYTFSTLQYDPSTILDTTFAPVLNNPDSIYVDTNKVPFHYRLKLDNSFGEELMGLDEGDNYASAENFIKAFDGLYIETDENAGGGSLLGFSLGSSYSQVVLYYNDSLKYTYPINNNDCVAFTSNQYDYSSASSLLKDQLDGDTTAGEQYLFASPLGGVKIKINIPYISSWHELTDIGINNARLILEVDELSDTTTYSLPSRLGINRYNEVGTLVFLKDELNDSDNIDGQYYESENAYIFNITRYLQQMILENKNEYNLFVFPRGTGSSAKRVVLKGPKANNSQFKLKLIYTKF